MVVKYSGIVPSAAKRKEKEERQPCSNAMPMCIVPCFELHHTKVDPQMYL